MERIARVGRTLRNNWKKSVLGAGVLYYAAATAKERYDISIVIRAACEEAALYGDARIPMDRNPRVITVILNPVANKRSAKSDYEKYCEPLLQLAGLQVDIVLTTSEGNAKEIVESLRGTEAIVVAGGDGTLAETVTGLLRRRDEANNFPIGVLPLGRTNTIGNSLFPTGKGIGKAKQLINASMAVIKAETEWKDVMKIEPIVNEDESPPRPIYALSSIEWGAFRDALARRDKYWFTGPLKEYATFIFNGYKNTLTWNCCGTLRQTPPCEGCSNCVQKRPEVKRKWAFFVPAAQTAKLTDYSNVINPNCAKVNEVCFKTCELKVTTSNIEKETDGKLPSLKVVLGKNNYKYTEFVSEGWNRIKKKEGPHSDMVEARTLEIFPKDEEESSNQQIAIDSEEFDVKPIKITLLPKAVKLFCNRDLR